MNKLVFIKRNKPFTDSKIIAECSGIRHDKIKRIIEKHMDRLKKFGKLSTPHEVESYTGGRWIEVYDLNEKQATFLITLLKNTDTVLDFKENLVSAFYEAKQLLLEKQTKDWEFQRLANKVTRKLETDQIKLFVNYAKEHGSKNADRYYTLFSKLANKYAYISNRDFSDFKKLKNLEMIENVINKEIIKLISNEVEYHVAYNTIKNKVIMISEYF